MRHIYRWWLGIVAAKQAAEQERWRRSERVLVDNMVHLDKRGGPEDLFWVREAKRILDQIVRPHLAC